jgi:ABC-type polar amino acid transport system ATPase subunit
MTIAERPPPVPITLEHVSKRYGSRVVLDDICFQSSGGETIALIGPSGGGKSTLLRCLTGLVGINQGTVRIGDHVLTGRPDGRAPGQQAQPLRRLFGMIFQDFQLFPHLTVLRNITEAPIHVLGIPANEAEQQARGLLKRVGLGDRAGAYPRQLSGGQKQRVAIARALAMKPRGLLCDEITSALDPELKHEVLEVVEDLKRDGLTLLIVTHEIGFARRVADRVLVLADARIIEDGPPEQVIDAPRHPRTREFLSRVMV